MHQIYARHKLFHASSISLHKAWSNIRIVISLLHMTTSSPKHWQEVQAALWASAVQLQTKFNASGTENITTLAACFSRWWKKGWFVSFLPQAPKVSFDTGYSSFPPDGLLCPWWEYTVILKPVLFGFHGDLMFKMSSMIQKGKPDKKYCISLYLPFLWQEHSLMCNHIVVFSFDF